MMTCRELGALLGELVAEELPAQARAWAEEHLSSCPPCGWMVESYRLTIRLAGRLGPLSLSPEQNDRLRSFLMARLAEQSGSVSGE